jgi:hypothetical protein
LSSRRAKVSYVTAKASGGSASATLLWRLGLSMGPYHP